ncbi:MAG: hypothetical protein JWQ23_4237 [Herminiimonas sp.]|nr:hypothetical protein [Herminiimonas sp.]
MNIQTPNTTPRETPATGPRAYINGRQPETSIFEATSPPATPGLSARPAFFTAQKLSAEVSARMPPRPQARLPSHGRIDQLRFDLEEITRLLNQHPDPSVFLPLLTDENILDRSEDLIGAIKSRLRSSETAITDTISSPRPDGHRHADGGDVVPIEKRLAETGAAFARNLFAGVSAHLGLLALLAEQSGATEPTLTRIAPQAAAALSAGELPIATETQPAAATPSRKRRGMQKHERVAKRARLDDFFGENSPAGPAVTVVSAAAAVPGTTAPVAAKKSRKKLLDRAKKSLRNIRSEGPKRSTSQDQANVRNTPVKTLEMVSGISAEAGSTQPQRGLKRKATPAANSGTTPMNTPRTARPGDEMQAASTFPGRIATPYAQDKPGAPGPSRVFPTVPPLRLNPGIPAKTTVAEKTVPDSAEAPTPVGSPHPWKTLAPQAPPRSHKLLISPPGDDMKEPDTLPVKKAV